MAYTFDSFDIAEVAQKCGITFNPQQKSSIEIEARCPFCDDRKYHLGINRNLERFHCFKCGEKGNSVSLYAKLYGVSNKEAYHSLKENLDSFDEKVIYLERGNEQEVRPLKDRHNVYYDKEMKRYSLETLQKKLEKWEAKYYEETMKPHNPRGYKSPNMAAWDRARTRVIELKEAIAEKKKDMGVA